MPDSTITSEITDSTIQAIADSVMHASQTAVVYSDSMQENSGLSLGATVTIVIALLVPVYFFGMTWLNGRYWDRGVFPPYLRFKRSNYFDAVMNLSTSILRCDADGRPEKISVLRHFAAEKFRDVDENVLEAVTSAANQPVSASSVARWLKKHLSSEPEKMAILQLLFDLALTDGMLGQKEYAILEAYSKNVGLESFYLEGLIATQK